MKKLIVILFIALLVGCSPAEKEVQIDGSIKTIGKNIILYGTSSLPEDTLITVLLKEIDSEDIKNEIEVKTDEDGNYQARFVREDPTIEYELNVLFEPHKQIQSIQESFGQKGEDIAESSVGYDIFQQEGEESNGIKMYDRILKIGDGSVGQNTSLSYYLPEY
jgi:hypothetical protein